MGKRWAILPFLLVAVSPHLINAEVYLLTESLFSLSIAVSLYLVCLWGKGRYGAWILFLAGVFLAGSALTRFTSQYLVLLWGGLIFFYSKNDRWKNLGCFLFGFFLIFFPWLLRNYLVLGYFSDSGLMLNTIVHGHYQNLMYENRFETIGSPYLFDPNVNSMLVGLSEALRLIFEKIKNDPLGYMQWYFLGKIYYFLNWNDYAAYLGFFTYPVMISPYFDQKIFLYTFIFSSYLHYAIVLLSLFGVVFCILKFNELMLKNYTSVMFVVIMLLYFIFVHIIGFPISRYSVPVLPSVYMLAIFFVKLVFDKYFKKQL